MFLSLPPLNPLFPVWEACRTSLLLSFAGFKEPFFNSRRDEAPQEGVPPPLFFPFTSPGNFPFGFPHFYV